MSEPKKIDPAIAAQITEEILDAVKAKAAAGTNTCPVLRKLAEEFGVPYRVVGAAADSLGVRIKNCDLGCF